jgi:hypothetical protein
LSQRDVIFQCRIVAAELRGTNSDLKIGGGLRRNRGGVQRGGVRPPAPWVEVVTKSLDCLCRVTEPCSPSFDTLVQSSPTLPQVQL